VLFITEVTLVLIFGVDYRTVQAPYIGPSLNMGLFDLPFRLLVPFLVSMVMVVGLQIFLSRTFVDAPSRRAQDQQALRLMAPTRPRSSASLSACRSPRLPWPAPV